VSVATIDEADVTENRVVSFALLPWYPASFLSSTRGWSVTAKGVYRELLDAQWDLGSLPADPGEIQALIGATKAEFKDWAAKIEAKFPICEDGRRRNLKLEDHRLHSIDRSRKAADSAKERWRKDPKRKSHASA
jgi:uncharacterized protein YdaU (DUF1376 family)